LYNQPISLGQGRSGESQRATEAKSHPWGCGTGRQDRGGSGSASGFFIFVSLPGAGAVLAPRLLVAFGSQRERYANAADVQGYSAIAPVTEQSGRKNWVHFRWPVHSLCSRPSTNGRDIPLPTRHGREATINNSGSEARGTTQRREGWPSNGFASFSDAGKIGWRMTRADISRRSPNETHR